MKKSLKLIAAGVLVMALVTGCGAKDAGDNKTPEGNNSVTSEDNGNVTLGEYKKLEVTKQDTTVTQSQLDAALEGVIQSNITHKEIKEGVIKKDDTVNIDYVGKKDGVEFEGGSSNGAGYDLTIGSGSFIPGFEDALIGVKIGTEKDINLTFPEDYKSKDLAGQDVVFHVTVNYLQGEEIVPTWNDEFVQSISEFKTVDEYKEDVKANLLKENEATAKSNQQNEAITKAVSNATIKELPEEELADHKQSVKDNITQMASYYGFTYDDYITMYYNTEEAFEEELVKASKQYISEKYVLNALVEKENLVPQKDYDAKALEFVTSYGAPSVEEFEKTYGEGVVKDEVYRMAGLDFLLANAVEVDATPEPEATEAPTEATEAPTEATEAPTEATEAPTEATEAPATTEATEAPDAGN